MKQLPNTPPKYVCPFVLHRKHESYALLKRNAKGDYTLMSEFCYCSFTKQKIGEIGFLAISQTEHVHEYGAILFISRTKARTKKLRLAFLLTCADKNGVPCSNKHLFSKKVSLLF